MKPRSLFAFAFVSVAAAIGCTSILGSFDVSSGLADAGPDGTGTGPNPPPPVSPSGDGGGDAPPACPDAGQMSCAGTCIDTTSSKLHCGACEHDCLGGSCMQSQCQPWTLFATTAGVPKTLIANDATVVYAQTNGDVIQVPFPLGGAATTLGNAGPPGVVYGVAFGPSSKVYVTAQNTPQTTTYDIYTATLGAPGIANSMSYYGFLTPPQGLAYSGTRLWMQVPEAAASPTYYLSNCAATGGCNATTYLGTPGKQVVAGSAGGVSYVFWTDTTAGKVYAEDTTSSAVTVVAMGEGTPDSVIWDGLGTVLWVDGASAKIRKSPFPMPAPADVKSLAGQAAPGDIRVDLNWLYYVQFDGMGHDVLYAIPRASPNDPPKKLAVVPAGTMVHLAENGLALFWLDGSAVHAIRKL
jgi:hypothetical protein